MSQGSSLNQGLVRKHWQDSGDIWTNNPIGSGLSNGKRDTSRSRGKLGTAERCFIMLIDLQ
jgi:hypothetical protein